MTDPGASGNAVDRWRQPVRELTWRDRLVALALMLGAFLVLFATQGDVGVGRDEGIYIAAAQTYRRYLDERAKPRAERQDRLSDAALIRRYYAQNAEHPPGTKHLYGLSWQWFNRCSDKERAQAQKRRTAALRARARGGRAPVPVAEPRCGPLGRLSSFRLPALIVGAILIGFIYLFGAAVFGRLAGFAAALAYFTLPRAFFHHHHAGLDGPITAMIVLTTYAYYRGLHSARWGVAAGLLFGLALLTKFNALFLPLLLIAHYGWATRREFHHPLLAVTGLASLLPFVFVALAALVAGGGAAWGGAIGACVVALFLLRRGWRTRPALAAARLAPFVFFSMLILGFGILYAQWPWLWEETSKRFAGYLGYHLDHTFYNTEYLGRNYNLPPFPVSYPVVLTVATMPLAFLLAAAGGIGLALREPARYLWALVRRRVVGSWPAPLPPDRWAWFRPLRGADRAGVFLVGLSAVFPIALIALPSTPIFGGTRLWMPAWPFLALLAGWVVQVLVRAGARQLPGRLGGRAGEWTLAGLLVGALAVPGALQTAHAGSLAPSYYAPLVGGAAGGADLGLKRQYWGYSTRQLLPTLDRLAAEIARGPRDRVGVYFHDTNGYSVGLYHRDRRLSRRVFDAGPGFPGIRRSRLALYLYERHQAMWEHRIWQAYGTLRPVRVLTLDGVPLITVYRRAPQRAGRRGNEPPFFEDPPGFTRRRGPR